MKCIFFYVVIFSFVFVSCYTKEKKQLTFTEDIAPIIHSNCTPCHRPGEAGPFPLITYSDVFKRLKTIHFVVRTGFMPPWPADKNYVHFREEKQLTNEEIKIIIDWIDNGALPGDTGLLAYIPQAKTSLVPSKPDLVLKMPTPIFIKGDNTDKFYVMKFPYELEKDTFIKAIEFVAVNKKLVHHVNGFLVQYDASKKKNVYEGEWYVNTEENHTIKKVYEKMSIPNDDGSYPMLTPSAVNYLPGMEMIAYPDGIGGYSIKRKGVLLLRDIHYGPSRIDQYDSSYINIYFDKKPPERRTLELQLGTLGVSEITPPLVIPPDSIKTFTTKVVIPIDISVLSVNPHMHLLGKSYHAYAITPAGDSIPLIRIKRWDFRWQYTYTYKKMLKIPAGSTIHATAVFDNTHNNPYNPFSPPQVVAERNGSMRTTDEMFQLMITYLPYKKGDENISLEKSGL